MKKQFAALLALSTAAACILTYQPTAVGAEEYSVLDNTDKLVQEALEDNTDELGDALYDSVSSAKNSPAPAARAFAPSSVRCQIPLFLTRYPTLPTSIE